MSDTGIEAKPGNPKADEAERIATQQRSGISVKQFCKEHGLTEYSFYTWRKRLQERGPVRFALREERTPAGAHCGVGAGTRVGAISCRSPILVFQHVLIGSDIYRFVTQRALL